MTIAEGAAQPARSGPQTEHLEPAPPGWREARLDMLLAEELAVDPLFAAHFAKEALAEAGCPPLTGPPQDVVVHFNVWHQVDDGSAGENDLDVTLSWATGATRRLLVEDKVSAPFQPDQALRYRRRAESCGAAAVLFAPRQFLESHPAEAHIFHGHHAIEALAEWLERDVDHGPSATARRLKWRARLLRELAQPRQRSLAIDHPPTIAFCDYCCDWLTENARDIDPNRRTLHTENQGWLWFNHPKDLVYKATAGFVDLYVAVHGFDGSKDDLALLLTTAGGPDGFVATNDTSGNVVLRYPTQRVSTAAGVPSDTSSTDESLAACKRVAEWLNRRGRSLLSDRSVARNVPERP